MKYNTNYCEWCLTDLKNTEVIKKPYGSFCCKQCLDNFVWCKTTRNGGNKK